MKFLSTIVVLSINGSTNRFALGSPLGRGEDCTNHSECEGKCKGSRGADMKCRERLLDCKGWGYHNFDRNWRCSKGMACTATGTATASDGTIDHTGKWGDCIAALTASPTPAPTGATMSPSAAPSIAPTAGPTGAPTNSPTITPTAVPTAEPTTSLPQTQAVTWAGVTNAATGADGALIANAADGSSSSKAGAYSTQTFTGDVSLDFSCMAYSGANLGLAVGNSNNLYTDIDCAFYCSNGGRLNVYERGSQIGFYGNYDASTKLSVRRVGSTVTYWKDGVLERTCAHALTGSVLADSALYSGGRLSGGGILTASFTAPTTSYGMSA